MFGSNEPSHNGDNEMNDIIIEECLEDLLKEMKLYVSKAYKTKDKKHKESKQYRIRETNIVKLKIPLMDLYQKAFAQGVYTATWKGSK